jgi:hypothetical protein
MPTSVTPACPGLHSTTVQSISSLVGILRSVNSWPAHTGSCSRMSAPWALTTSVFVRSENAAPLACLPRTMIPTHRKIRWLRLWLVALTGRVLWALTIHLFLESGMHGESQMATPERFCYIALVPCWDRPVAGPQKSLRCRTRCAHPYEYTLICRVATQSFVLGRASLPATRFMIA